MGKVKTPHVITPKIRELCRFISEHEPVFVTVIDESSSIINECFVSVKASTPIIKTSDQV